MNSKPVETIVVLGGGSAGLISAITLKRKLPHLSVRVVRSVEIGIIGVGEGTTRHFGEHFFRYLGLNPRQFYKEAEPIWKLGIRFLWGPKEDFFYTFAFEFDENFPALKRAPGFYGDAQASWRSICSACMVEGRVFPRTPAGIPDLGQPHGFHVENAKLVKWLENTASTLGVKITEGTMLTANREGELIKSLVLESGEVVEADLFVDSSGFRSELLTKTLEEPFVSFGGSLFCDRAVIGGWPRTTEPIRGYTTAETMNSGWCWQIDHENWINRGYVYSSSFISDEQALAELHAKNPLIANQPRVVKFRSGRTERSWVGNVVGIGNASGFVEPLEATALHIICVQSRRLADTLMTSGGELTESLRDLFNEANDAAWAEIRDFLAVHYKFNTRLDTEFWQHCRAETSLGGAERIVNFYQENGPIALCKGIYTQAGSQFGMEGFLALLVGQQVPHRRAYTPPANEAKLWNKHLSELQAAARRGFTVEQALAVVRSSSWKWNAAQ